MVLALTYISPTANGQTNSSSGHIPVIDSDRWRICTMPDLGPLNGPDQSKQHIVDHGFIKNDEGKWILWACMRGTAPGRILYGWEGASLTDSPWESTGIVARALPEWGEKTNPESIQAHYFMKCDSGYYCFYNFKGIKLARLKWEKE